MDFLPAIDILDGKVVRLAKGDYDKVTVYNEDPLAQAQKFEEAGARWIHIVDLDGARSGVPKNIKVIEQIARGTHLKIEVGGGIRNLETIERLERAGATRIVLGTSLVCDPVFAKAALLRYKPILTAGIDARDGEVAVAGWEQSSGVTAESLMEQMAELGFKHVVYTDISRDGMQTGVDTSVYVEMAKLFKNPVIASGGIACIDDVKNLAEVADSIEGVIAGRAIYEGSLEVSEAVKVCEKARPSA